MCCMQLVLLHVQSKQCLNHKKAAETVSTTNFNTH